MPDDIEETQDTSTRALPIELGGDFTLDGHFGSPVSLSDFSGKVVLLLFGYTYCPDVCPTQLHRLKEVMDKLGNKADSVQVLLITVDPERDTPERLKKFVTHFHPNFLGLTGPREKIQAVARQYGIGFPDGEKSGDDYTVDHSSSIYLINQRGVFCGLYSHNTPSDKLVEEIKRLVGP